MIHRRGQCPPNSGFTNNLPLLSFRGGSAGTDVGISCDLRCCVLPIEEIATALKGLAMTVVVDCWLHRTNIRFVEFHTPSGS